jgi:hypothetical protein
MKYLKQLVAKQLIDETGKSVNHLSLKLKFPNKQVFTSRALIVFLLLVGLFIGFRVWHLTDFSLWTDEIFSLNAVRLPWISMFETLVLDKVHPQLFYVLLKIWITIGGQSLLWLKLFPFLTAVATIIPFYLLCRELNLSAYATNVTLALMAVNGYLIHYAQEVRMYSLLIFFTVSSFWLFVRFVNRDTSLIRHLCLLFIVNLLLVYTHYFGWLVVGVEGIFLLWLNRQKFLLLLISILGLVLCYIPWIYVVVNAISMKRGPVHGLDWIPRPDLYSLHEYFAILTGPHDFLKSTSIRLLLFGSPILLWFWHILRKRQTDNSLHKNVFWWLIISFSLPLIFAFAFSIFGPKSIWGERYLLIVVIPFMLLVGIALDKLQPNWLRACFLFLIVVWSVSGGIVHINKGETTTRVPWQKMIQEMIQSEPTDARDVKVFQFNTNINRPIQFYLNELDESRFQTVIVKDATAVEGNHFWVAFHEAREANLPILEILRNRGYRVDKEITFENSRDKVYLVSVRLQQGPSKIEKD